MPQQESLINFNEAEESFCHTALLSLKERNKVTLQFTQARRKESYRKEAVGNKDAHVSAWATVSGSQLPPTDASQASIGSIIPTPTPANF